MTEDTQPRSMRDIIHDLATGAGATFAVNQFDGGQFFTITKPGVGSVRASYEWGDSEAEVIEVLKTKMTAAGMFTVKREFLLDYGSGRTARIWAASEEQAVRLAMQGEPESITDLTTGEAKAWVSPT